MASASEIRREIARTSPEYDEQDDVDQRGTHTETPQEMHERMAAEDAAEEAIETLESLKALQSGELTTWTVHRVADGNGSPLRSGPSEYCGVLGGSSLSMENIANLYGGGKYRVRGRYSDGKFAGERKISIAADIKRDMTAMQQPSSTGFNMQEFLAMMAVQDDKREQRAAEARREADARMERLLAIALPVAGQIVTAFASRASSPATDLPALITALKPAPVPVQDPISGVKSLAETLVALQGISGGGGNTDSGVEIIKAIAPYAGPVLTALAQRPSVATAPRRVSRPIPGSQPSRTVIEQPAQNLSQPVASQDHDIPVHTGVNLDAPSEPLSQEQRNMFAQLKPQVDALVTMASQGADPIETANVFFDTVMTQMDDNTYGMIANFLDDKNAISKITIFNTGVNQHRDFFEAFQKHVMERISAEDQAAQSAG